SRIIALPANPDTVRGFAGDVVLDEFAFHRDAEAIWRAAFATATRGFQIEIISTPNGTRGKYYELAKAAGLVDWQAGMSAPLNASILSPHWVDLAEARGQGFRVDVEALRAAIGDQDAWEQEYCCRFLSDVAHYIPPELVVAAESSAATSGFELSGETRTGFPQASSQDGLRPASFSAGLKPRPSHAYQGPRLTGHVFLGVDIGRKRDLTVLWLLEAGNPEAPPEARAYVTRGVLTLDRKPFAQQRAAIEALLAERQESQISDCRFQIHRCAMDASGLGAMLAEELAARWGERVEPVVFTSTVKEMLAVRVKRLLEERRLKIPYDPAIRAALGSVKRLVTAAGNVRFDAERTDASGHADHFWALALALHAAEEPGLSVEYVSNAQPRASTLAHSF
ncbi:MAG: hypothetical protein ACRD4T_10480, partial [Candidatus Acidiferrales bacterium]